MDNRHRDALRRIAQADEMWSRDGNEPTAFHLVHRGGLQKDIDHPRWGKSWSVPGAATIDDLQELGLLRVDPIDPSRNKARTFWLTMMGREKAAELGESRVMPLGDVSAREAVARPVAGEDGASASTPTAVVSWAHGDGDWQATILAFSFALRRLGGVDADVDLLHLNDLDVDWTTYGPQAIQDREFVLIAVSATYKERWEGRNDPRIGAGAAREANVLKSLFNDDQQSFREKVKVVVLPGATTDDIPAELKAAVHRFEISTLDERGLEELLRTLTRQPAFVAPPLGNLPLLPPRSVQAGNNPPPPPTEAVAEAVMKLPERQKLVIALTYWERLTREEIAKVLDVSPNEVSHLAQDATSALGHSLSADLASEDEMSKAGQHHSGRIAHLVDGPRSGEHVSIEPGQVALALSERFDYDQGYAEVIDHYGYEPRTSDDPDTVMFTFRHQEHRVATDR